VGISVSYSGFTDNINIYSNLNSTYWTASISNFVWEDIDTDGKQDEGEPGIEGVVVNLYDSLGGFLATRTTDSTGFYIFDNLEQGEYYLEFIPPEGYSFSPTDSSDDEHDSDADINTGLTAIIYLETGEYDDTVDAGLYQSLVLEAEGCSHGYWKVSVHWDDWVGFTTDQILNEVFSFPADISEVGLLTFIQAMEFTDNGGGLIGKTKILMVQAVPAILNAAHPDVNYPFSLDEVITETNAALASLDPVIIEDLKNLFDQYNNLGSDLCN
jgi:hypothetical protein